MGWRRHAENPEKALPLLGHLEELRTRLITSVVAVLIGFVVGWFLAPAVLDILKIPVEQSGLIRRDVGGVRVDIDENGTWHFANPADLLELQTNREGQRRLGSLRFHIEGQDVPVATWESVQTSGVIYLRPTDPVMIRIKAALIIGVVLAIPVILYQVYAFIAPGLYPSERRAVRPIFFGSVLLFPIGAGFAYYMLTYALMFLASFATTDVYIFNDMRAYLSLALTMMLAFGILFQLPIVVLVLTRLGIVNADWLAKRRRGITIGLLLVAAFVTPPDPFTMLALALPLYVLFEVSILLSRLQGTRAHRASDAEATEA